jgi:hypothetical protein
MPESDAIQRRKSRTMNGRALQWLSWSVILLCSVLIVLTGWFRERYILNFFLADMPLLIHRSAPNLQSYPLGIGGLWQQLFRDPRWLTTILLNGAMMLSSALIVGLWFREKVYFWLVIGAYVLLIGLCGLLVGVSLFMQSYEAGYSIAQQLKNLLQMPFLLILFVPVLHLYEKQNPAE